MKSITSGSIPTRAIRCKLSHNLCVPSFLQPQRCFRGKYAIAVIGKEEESSLEAQDVSEEKFPEFGMDGDSAPECVPFIDRDGNFVEIMCSDYGFRSGAGRLYQDRYGEIPPNAWKLATDNFRQEWAALRVSFRSDDYKTISDRNPAKTFLGKAFYSLAGYIVQGLASLEKSLPYSEDNPQLSKPEKASAPTESFYEIQSRLKDLKLSNQAVWDREKLRESEGKAIKSSWYIKGAYLFLCVAIDVLYRNRPLQRFWFLEMVARMPYFSFISMLHFYESLGWWRASADVRKIHFAEEWNELHHLQIMEALGGDQLWIDRFMAMHASIAYYWIILLFYVISPKTAYNFSELVEYHASETYDEFLESNEELLKALPPPLAAVQYYRGEDLYMFDNFQTSNRSEPRRPDCKNLYDVFKNIAEDEAEHLKTMKACQDESIKFDLSAKKQQDLIDKNSL